MKGKRVIIGKIIFFKHLNIAHSKETDFKLCCILVPLFPELKNGLGFILLFRTFVLL